MDHPTTTVETEQDDNNDEMQDDIQDVLTDAKMDVKERQLSDAVNNLENVSADDVADLSDEKLVSLRQTLKSLEDIAEDVRKDVVDSEVKDRVEPGESLLGLNHIKSHNKYVEDSPGRVIMRAVSMGVDYTEFVDLKASVIADMDENIAEIGQYEYTYLR